MESLLPMTDREMEILGKLLARANPPPVLYRYRQPNEWTLSEISKHQVFAARPEDLNDPFEYSAPVRVDLDSMRREFIQFMVKKGVTADAAAKDFSSATPDWILRRLGTALAELRKASGVICMSATPNSIRMWSYYARAHQGVCLGFDTQAGPFMAAMKVLYQNPEAPLELLSALSNDPSDIAGHISLRKAAEWEFEQEYRIPVGPVGDRPRAMPFHPSALIEIRLGACINDDFRSKLMQTIKQLEYQPKIIQMGCDFDRCLLTETVISV